MAIAVGSTDLVISVGADPIGKISIGDTLVYSAGCIVTYHVDTGMSYSEEVNSGDSCLKPKSFTPQKNGWTFVGWRQDTLASDDVLDSLLMDDEPIELYAVFEKTVVVTYYNGSTTKSSASGTQFYNNGSVVSPSFTIVQATKSGWTARGWAKSTAGNASVIYSALNGTVISESITLYGLYYQQISLSYNGNGSTGGSVATQTAYRYYNSAGNTNNPTFVVLENGFTKTNYEFLGWTLGSTTGTSYAVGDKITLSANSTLYAAWKANPFYWIQDGTVQDGFPSAYETYSLSPSSAYLYSKNLTNAYVYGVQESNTTFTGETIAVATRGNKYIEITMNNSNVSGTNSSGGTLNSFMVAGVECKDQVATNAVITVDVSSKSEVTLKLIMTAWAWGNTMNHYIKSIRFYS